MEGIYVVLLSLTSAAIVLVAVVVVLNKLDARQAREAKVQLALEQRRVALPIRLQAYERLAMLLERIAPEALLLRVSPAGKSAKEYEAELLEQVREEWNHNLSQQIYVSEEAWARVREARGNIAQFINLCNKDNPDQATGKELAQMILAALLKLETHPGALAQATLRHEASELF